MKKEKQSDLTEKEIIMLDIIYSKWIVEATRYGEIGEPPANWYDEDMMYVLDRLWDNYYIMGENDKSLQKDIWLFRKTTWRTE